MNSLELADAVEELIRQSKSRVMGTGHEQYSEGENQRFEGLPLGDVFQYAYEEIEDLVAYATMVHIRLHRLEDKINDRLSHLKELDCL